MRFTKKMDSFESGVYIILVILSLLFIIPFLLVVVTSIVTEEELIRKGGFVFFPETFSFTSYSIILSTGSVILSGYAVTVVRTLLGTFMSIAATTAMAYGLSKKHLYGRNVILTLVFFTMLFSGGIIPQYILLDSMRLTNSIWSLVLPGLVNAWYLIIMKNYFVQLPVELEESARIDGANDLHIFFRIILPLSTATIATFCLFYAVGHWNSWFDAMIYIRDAALKPLALILRAIVMGESMRELSGSAGFMETARRPPSESIRAASIIISIGPIVMAYPFVQKHFVKGIMVGAVKG